MATLPTVTYYWRQSGAADNAWTEDADGVITPTAGQTIEVVSVGPSKPAFRAADTTPSVSLTAINANYGTGVTVNPTYGGTNRAYTLTGPDWLSINPTNGQITGTAPSADVSTTYTVTVSNAHGSVSDTEAVTVSAAPVVQAHVFALIGQSNIVGRGPDSGATAWPAGTMQWDQNGAWAEIVQREDHPQDTQAVLGITEDGDDTIGPARGFAAAYAAANPGVTVYLVGCGIGGTSVLTWRDGENSFNPARNRINAAMLSAPAGAEFRGFLWLQGGADGTMTEAQYRAQIDAVISEFRTSVTAADADTPFVIGQNPILGSSFELPVQSAGQSVPVRVAYTGIASGTVPTEGPLLGDGIHLDETGVDQIGAEFARALTQAEANTTTAATGAITLGTMDEAALTGVGKVYTGTLSIGTAADDRIVVVAIGTKSSQAAGVAFESVKVGGISARRLVTNVNVEITIGYSVALFEAAVPTGTTAEVEVVIPADRTEEGVAVVTLPVYGARLWTTTAGLVAASTASGASPALEVGHGAGDLVLSAWTGGNVPGTFVSDLAINSDTVQYGASTRLVRLAAGIAASDGPTTVTWASVGQGSGGIVAAAKRRGTGSGDNVIIGDGVVATYSSDGTDVTVSISAPPEYAGTVVVAGAVAAMASGPVEVIAPTASSDAGTPQPTFTAVPGVWMGENGAITTVQEWLVNGVVVGTGTTYTRTAGQESLLIEYRERAADTAGETTGTAAEAQAVMFPNVLRMASVSLVLGPQNVTASAATIAGRFRFNSWGNFETAIRLSNTTSFLLLRNSTNIQYLIRDTDSVILANNATTTIVAPANDTWRSYVMAIDLTGGLPGGAHFSLWVDGETFTATLPSVGTGLITSGGGGLDTFQAGAADIEEFLLYDFGRAVDPATLGPLLFDATNGYAARDIIAAPPLGPWQFAIGGPVSNWVAGANSGDDLLYGLDSNATPVTDITL